MIFILNNKYGGGRFLGGSDFRLFITPAETVATNVNICVIYYTPAYLRIMKINDTNALYDTIV